MDVEEVLKDLDLTESEIDLYLTLINCDEGTASAVAKKAGVHRRLAYDQFESLVDRGLVSYVDRDDRRIYRPVDPKRLQDMVDDRKRNLEELGNRVNEAIEEIRARYDRDAKERAIKIMEGKEGIKHLFNDELRTGDTIHLIGSPAESEEVLEYFLPSWTRKRSEEDILIRGVFEHEMRGMVGEHAPIEDRYLPEGESSSLSVAIYGDKVGITFWIENPLVIMIEDKDAAESFMSYFELAWEAAEE